LISDTELQLIIQAGHLVDLVVETGKEVVINGNLSITREVVFSDDVVVHVLGNPRFW